MEELEEEVDCPAGDGRTVGAPYAHGAFGLAGLGFDGTSS